jgi:hypothetical protein
MKVKNNQPFKTQLSTNQLAWDMEGKEGPSTINKEETYSSQWENATIDKSATNSNIRGLELLVPWLTVANAITTKTVYTKMLPLIEDLLCLY